jgi:hypothetical protein
VTDDPKNDPQQWVASRDPMTEAQRIKLERLSDQTGEPASDDHLSKAEADQKIAELLEEAGNYDDKNTDDQDEP